MKVAPGATLGQYRIEAFLGAGDMGAVYRARDEQLQRDVALKIVSDEGTGGRGRHDHRRTLRTLPSAFLFVRPQATSRADRHRIVARL